MSDEPNTNTPAPEPQKTRAEWERERQAELAQKTVGDLASKVATLEYDLHIVRAKVPAEGSLVLSKPDAERWEKYQALGKPDELETTKTERDTLKTDLAGRDRRESIRAAADVSQFKPGVLERLAPADAAFEIREATVDGKPVKTAYLKLQDGSEKSLTEWAAAEHADFMPSLQVQAEPIKEMEFVNQRGSGKEPVKGIAKAQNARAASHLRPKES